MIPSIPRFTEWGAKVKVDGTQPLIPISGHGGAPSVEQMTELMPLIANPNGQLGVGIRQWNVGVAMLAFVFD